MTNTFLRTIVGAALLVPALAFAEVIVSNGEAGMIFKDEPSTLTREQVRADMTSTQVSRDSAQYVGGEAGYALSNARYEFDGTRLVHAADCPILANLAAPRPAPSEPFFGHSGA